METAREFLLAIKEATGSEYDADAVEFLDKISSYIFASLDKAGAAGRRRDNIIFWEGMLKGVQLQLKKRAQHAKARLFDLGMLNAEGKPKETEEE
jgi:hypothetical protein